MVGVDNEEEKDREAKKSLEKQRKGGEEPLEFLSPPKTDSIVQTFSLVYAPDPPQITPVGVHLWILWEKEKSSKKKKSTNARDELLE